MVEQKFKDDVEGISDRSTLIRRIHVNHWRPTMRDAFNRPLIVSQAVKSSGLDEPDVGRLPESSLSFYLEGAGETVQALAARYPEDGLARVSVGMIRSLKDGGEQALGILKDPTQEHPSHVVVFRLNGAKNISNGQAKRIAASLMFGWIKEPATEPRVGAP